MQLVGPPASAFVAYRVSNSTRIAIFRYLLFALTKALHNRRSPWYQRSLIREPLRKISVILSDDIQRSFLGQLTMVLSK